MRLFLLKQELIFKLSLVQDSNKVFGCCLGHCANLISKTSGNYSCKVSNSMSHTNARNIHFVPDSSIFEKSFANVSRGLPFQDAIHKKQIKRNRRTWTQQGWRNFVYFSLNVHCNRISKFAYKLPHHINSITLNWNKHPFYGNGSRNKVKRSRTDATDSYDENLPDYSVDDDTSDSPGDQKEARRSRRLERSPLRNDFSIRYGTGVKIPSLNPTFPVTEIIKFYPTYLTEPSNANHKEGETEEKKVQENTAGKASLKEPAQPISSTAAKRVLDLYIPTYLLSFPPFVE